MRLSDRACTGQGTKQALKRTGRRQSLAGFRAKRVRAKRVKCAKNALRAKLPKQSPKWPPFGPIGHLEARKGGHFGLCFGVFKFKNLKTFKPREARKVAK